MFNSSTVCYNIPTVEEWCKNIGLPMKYSHITIHNICTHQQSKPVILLIKNKSEKKNSTSFGDGCVVGVLFTCAFIRLAIYYYDQNTIENNWFRDFINKYSTSHIEYSNNSKNNNNWWS